MDPDKLQLICTELKRRMMEMGILMVAYQSINNKNIPSCFRLTFSALPVYKREDVDFVVVQMELLGKDIYFG